MKQTLSDGRATVYLGDNRDVLKTIADNSIDSVVTDPPYALVSIAKRFGKEGSKPAQFGKDGAYARAAAGFMGKVWDTGEVAFAVEFWAEIYRVLKPGGHVLSFGGTRTYHRLACAIEDAGFEIRDQVGWAFGSGFPKSHNVSKSIDKALGVRGTFGASKSSAHAGWISRGAMRGDDSNAGWQRPWMDDPQAVDDAARGYAPASAAAAAWDGWGTALKPAWEPVCVARKPLIGTIAENVLMHGTGALNIDGCRVAYASATDQAADAAAAAQRAGADQNANRKAYGDFNNGAASIGPYLETMSKGRWPANLLHNGSDEVLACFPGTGASKAGGRSTARNFGQEPENAFTKDRARTGHSDEGGTAARFFASFPQELDAQRLFYCPKASAADRAGSKHPTVKPQKLMRYLCRLVTPPGGTVLDPFAGSGSTLYAALDEGFSAIGIEREAEYHAHIVRQLGGGIPEPEDLFGAPPQPTEDLFGDSPSGAMPSLSDLSDVSAEEDLFA